MKIRLLITLLLTAVCQDAYSQVSVWLTNADKSALFAKQKQTLVLKVVDTQFPVITVDEFTTYQTIDGFGFALTGGSAQHIIHMSPAARTALLKELFGTDNSTVTKQVSGSGNQIGISYLRLSIGASDLNDHVFSYDDLPAAQTDTAMLQFDLGPDKENVVPVMKEILKINPATTLCALKTPSYSLNTILSIPKEITASFGNQFAFKVFPKII